MRTTDFLRSVLPSKGWYFLAVPYIRDGAETGGYKHIAFDDIDKMGEAAVYISSKDKNVFYALGGFEQPEYIGADGKKHWRGGENVRAFRSQWLDMDGDKKQNIRDLYAFCKATSLPYPTHLVNSGNGIHVYWVFDRDVPRDVWKKVADAFKALVAHYNLAQQDTARTADVSSVLRPIGVINDKRHKGKGVKDVKLLEGFPASEGPINFTDWVRRISELKRELGFKTANTSPAAVTSDLAGGMDQYPPASAKIAAEHCAQLKFFRDYKGAGQNEPTWRACLGVVKHCVEGEELAHEWSSGHDGYDAGECSAKIAGWKTGPTTCDTFKACDASICAGCPHNVKSPIQLGKLAPEQATEVTQVDQVTQEPVTEELPEMPPEIAARYRFTGKYLEARTEDKEGVEKWMPFCATYIRPIGYFMDKNEKNIWKMRIDCRMRPGKWQLFEVTARSVGQGGSVLMGELSARAFVVPAFGQSRLLEDYMKTWAEHLKHTVEETTMHMHMGWQPDDSFVLGDRKYMPDGSIRRVVLDETLRNQLADFELKGNATRWSELINELYNRPGHEMYQFTLMQGFGSILINLINPEPMGLIGSALGDSGYGKTTVAQLAGGIWHRPSKVVTKSTEYATYLNAGQRRNLPLIVDETSQWESKQLADYAYMYSSGTAKEQGRADGGLRDNSHLNWNNISILTTNRSVYEALQAHRADCVPQLMRVFEYSFGTGHKQTADARTGIDTIPELMSMSGVAGDAFLKYVVPNRLDIRDRLTTTYIKLMEAAGLEKDARFWCYLAAVSWVAFEITGALGLHSFDKKAQLRWLVGELKKSKVRVHQATRDMSLVLGDLMADLHSGFIVTLNEGHNNGASATLAPGVAPPRGEITGRVITSANAVYLKHSAVRDWCTKHGFSMVELKNALDAKGWTRPAEKYSLGRGTPYSVPQTRVWRLNWAAVSGQLHVAGQPQQPVEEEVAA